MKSRYLALALALAIVGLALAWAAPANAQGVTRICIETVNTTTGANNCQEISIPFPLPVTTSTGTTILGTGAGTTGAVAATLAGVAGKTTFICDFDISAIGGTAAVGPITITGLIGSATFTYQMSSSAAGVTLSRVFTPCIPASAVNTGIVITTTADGTATAVDVNAHGYQR